MDFTFNASFGAKNGGDGLRFSAPMTSSDTVFTQAGAKV